MSLAKNVGNSVATYAVFKSYIGVIFSIIFAIIAVVVGVYFLFKRNNRKKTSAIITSSDCGKETITKNNKTETKYNCNMNVSYSVNGVKYNDVHLKTNNKTKYNTGMKIDIFYDLNDHTNIEASVFPYKITGIVLIIIAAFMVGGSLLHRHMVTKYKAYAVASGTANIVSMVLPKKKK